jgi:hypothetical protein
VLMRSSANCQALARMLDLRLREKDGAVPTVQEQAGQRRRGRLCEPEELYRPVSARHAEGAQGPLKGMDVSIRKGRILYSRLEKIKYDMLESLLLATLPSNEVC